MGPVVTAVSPSLIRRRFAHAPGGSSRCGDLTAFHARAQRTCTRGFVRQNIHHPSDKISTSRQTKLAPATGQAKFASLTRLHKRLLHACMHALLVIPRCTAFFSTLCRGRAPCSAGMHGSATPRAIHSRSDHHKGVGRKVVSPATKRTTIAPMPSRPYPCLYHSGGQDFTFSLSDIFTSDPLDRRRNRTAGQPESRPAPQTLSLVMSLPAAPRG